MEKVKPINCWCGCEADVYTSAYSHRIHVSCSKTNEHVPWENGFDRNGGFDSEDTAIRDWNHKMQQLVNLLKLTEARQFIKEREYKVQETKWIASRFTNGRIIDIIPPEVEYDGLSGLLGLFGYTAVNVLDIVNYEDIQWEGIEFNRLYEKDGTLYRFNEWRKTSLGRSSAVIQEIGVLN